MDTTPLKLSTVLAVSAVALAAALAGPTVATASPGAEAALTDVPWSQVGPGWTLATWSPLTPHMPGAPAAPGEPQTSTLTLYLIGPTGDRYAITTFPAGEQPDLLDWSGDGSHALLGTRYPAPETVRLVDLHTGADTDIAANGHPEFSKPEGKAILVSTDGNDHAPSTLKRLGLDGTEQMSYPTESLRGTAKFTGQYVESPDGSTLVLGTHRDLTVMRNDGTIVRALPAPMTNAECRPVRWWTAQEILTHCDVERSSASQLWTVPLDGSPATPLTALNSGQGDDPGFRGDMGDGAAWQLPGGTFLQSAGACGSMFLSRLTADGHTTRVTVPGLHDSVRVAGANAGKLDLLGKVGCGGTDSLVRYDTVADTSTVLLGPPVNGGGVTEAIPFPAANWHR